MIQRIRRPAGLALLVIMLAVFIIPAPQLSQVAGVSRSFDKPASTYTGPATVTCFTSPDSSWAVLRGLMRGAQSEMLICVYSISNGFLVNEIENALERNSSMEIKILVSWKWASPAERTYTKGAFYNLSQHAAFENNLWLVFSEDTDLEFTHGKYMIYDREVLIVQSCNWAKSGIPPRNSTGNREWGVAIRQPDVVNYFMEVFTSDWLLPNIELYTPNPGDAYSFSNYQPGGSYSAPHAAQTYTDTMSIQCILSPDNSVDTILALIRSATYKLDVQQMYIKPTWGPSYPNQFLEEILEARRRGVLCRVIMDEKDDDNAGVADTLVDAGVGVSWQGEHWGSGGYWMHNKGIIVDGRKVLVSSINWSNYSVSQNREAGVLITHTGVAGFFASVFQWDWEHSVYLGGLGLLNPFAPVLDDVREPDINGEIELSWSMSWDLDGSVEYYQIQMSSRNTFTAILGEWEINGLYYDVSGLSAGTYFFRVRAVDDDGLYSPWSNIDGTTVVPGNEFPFLIPGYPWEAILLSLVLVLAPALITRRHRQYPK